MEYCFTNCPPPQQPHHHDLPPRPTSPTGNPNHNPTMPPSTDQPPKSTPPSTCSNKSSTTATTINTTTSDIGTFHQNLHPSTTSLPPPPITDEPQTKTPDDVQLDTILRNENSNTATPSKHGLPRDDAQLATMLRPTAQQPPHILSNDDIGKTIPSATAQPKPTAISLSLTTVRDSSNSTDARGHNRLVPQITENEPPDTQHSTLLHASRPDGTDTTNASSRGAEQNINISHHHQTHTILNPTHTPPHTFTYPSPSP